MEKGKPSSMGIEEMMEWKRATVRQADVRRVVRAAHAEGLNPRTIRVATSGEVSVEVGDITDQDVSALDQWRGRRHAATAQRH